MAGPGRPPSNRGGLKLAELRRRNRVRFEADRRAQRLLERNPDGMTLEQVAAYLGLTRQGVQLIERAALRKLQRRGELVLLRPWMR